MSDIQMIRQWRRLQKVDEDTYTGECDSEHPQARVFGGHVLAQAMSAAYYTAPEGFCIHSLHCYFVRGGEEDYPVTYKVTRVRDGRNFAVRYVEAKQHGKTIHLSEFSMQKLSSVTDNFVLSPAFPEGVPPPDNLKNDIQLRHEYLTQGYDLRDARGVETSRMAPSVDVRPVDPETFLHGSNGKHFKQMFWIRYKNTVDPEDYKLQHATLVYFSDLGPVSTGTLAHKERRFKLATSMDHSAWIHDYRFNVNDWFLYEQECVANAKHRSLISGRMWSQDGRLIMTTTQEALVYKTKM